MGGTATGGTCEEAARRATLIEVLGLVRREERSALACRGGPFEPSAASKLYDLAEQIAELIDPNWGEAPGGEELGPFALLRGPGPSSAPRPGDGD